MNTEEKSFNFDKIQTERDRFIRQIDKEHDKTEFVKKYSDSLFHLGLSMYSRNYSFESSLYGAFAMSELDDNISLHPEQIKALSVFDENEGTIFSAPTSFGKTFVVFEYIAKEKPRNVVMIVPTLALIDEYKTKIIKKYKDVFYDYNLYLSINEEKEYDFTEKNIFVITHDRVVHEDVVNLFERIDLLVIDEVYKLQKDVHNDRVLILNMAYYHMVKKCNKYILLAPFISGVDNIEKLDKSPMFHSTDFSPVVNEVITYDIASESDRSIYIEKVLKQIPQNENTLIYFPTVKGLNDFIYNSIQNVPVDFDENQMLTNFIEWARTEIHEDWVVTKAISNGYLVHHGQLPLGIRLLQLDLFNDDEKKYNRLLCTSTLLEGVNTTAKHVVITKPCRGYNMGDFDAFDFYNLVGRTGRLYEHYLGLAHYIKSPLNPRYYKDEALKRIEFELTDDDNIDIDINCDNYEKHPNFIAFLERLGIGYDQYKKNIGPRCRFSTVTYLLDNYEIKKSELLTEIHELSQNDNKSKLSLIRILYEIINGKKYSFKLDTFIINRLTYLNRPSIRDVVTGTLEYYPNVDINQLISKTIRFKSSYIEYDFLNRVELILYFMLCQNVDQYYIDTVNAKLIKNIEVIYFLSSPAKKLLKDLGVYEKDIDRIINAIGDEFSNVAELISLLRKLNYESLNISVVSKYVIRNLL